MGHRSETATMQTVLADWLVANGLAEKERGYGHATGEDIAAKLLDAFDVRFKEPEIGRSTDG